MFPSVPPSIYSCIVHPFIRPSIHPSTFLHPSIQPPLPPSLPLSIHTSFYSLLILSINHHSPLPPSLPLSIQQPLPPSLYPSFHILNHPAYFLLSLITKFERKTKKASLRLLIFVRHSILIALRNKTQVVGHCCNNTGNKPLT